jgi:hypothetical protein
MLLSESIKELQKILDEYGDGLLLVNVDSVTMGNYLDTVEIIPCVYSFLRKEDNCILIITKEFGDD